MSKESEELEARNRQPETITLHYITESEDEDFKEVQGGHIRIVAEACSFTWSIENSSLCSLKYGEYLISPYFTAGKGLIWCLKLFPNEKNQSVPFIYLELVSAEPSPHCATYEISIIASHKTQSFSKKIIHFYFDYGGSTEFIGRNVLLENKPSSLLPNDTMMLKCEMKVSFGVKTPLPLEDDNSPFSVSRQPTPLIGSLQHLYESEMFSDLIIKVGDEELKCHKNILCARSSVFNAMLTTDMKESIITNCIEISDFDISVVRAMLRYIYCEQVEGLTPDSGIQLYSIADKYNLQDLKDICVTFLLKNLNVNNICDVLVLCDMHNEQELMAAAKKMFCVNAAAIQETEKWLDLAKERPELSIAMYHFVTSQK